MRRRRGFVAIRSKTLAGDARRNFRSTRRADQYFITTEIADILSTGSFQYVHLPRAALEGAVSQRWRRGGRAGARDRRSQQPERGQGENSGQHYVLNEMLGRLPVQ